MFSVSRGDEKWTFFFSFNELILYNIMPSDRIGSIYIYLTQRAFFIFRLMQSENVHRSPSQDIFSKMKINVFLF